MVYEPVMLTPAERARQRAVLSGVDIPRAVQLAEPTIPGRAGPGGGYMMADIPTTEPEVMAAAGPLAAGAVALSRIFPWLARAGARAWPWLAGAAGGFAIGEIIGEQEAALGPGGIMETTPVPIGGPGLAEPGKPHLIKEWHITYPKGRIQYYLVQRVSPRGRITRYIMAYKTWDGTWKWWVWRTPALAVIGKNMPSHKMLTRLKNNLKRHTTDARTILEVTSPRSLAKNVVGYKRGRRYIK